MQSLLRPRIRASQLNLIRPAPFSRPLQPRTFVTSRSLRLKEDTPQDPEELDRVKKEQVQKQKEGKGHWHEELASHSETAVKAEKEHGGKGVEEMQQETAQQAEQDHPHGKKGQ